jgi:hypothetical protein
MRVIHSFRPSGARKKREARLPGPEPWATSVPPLRGEPQRATSLKINEKINELKP